MTLPWGVLGFYAALVVWIGMLVQGFRTGVWRTFILFGLGLTLFLNVRYLIEGVPAGAAFFIGIYDIIVNFGLSGTEQLKGLTTFHNNACTVWGDIYTQHSTWSASFHDRFANAPPTRTVMLYGHIIFNTTTFLLLHVQMFKPGGSSAWHKLIGRVTFASLTIALFCGGWLSSEFSLVPSYGAIWAQWGFYSMIALVYGTALMGIVAIRSSDAEAHRVWMWRFAGSMWGAFWGYRVIMLVLDPFLRYTDGWTFLIPSWVSVPAGILIAEAIRLRRDRRLSAFGQGIVPAE